MDAAVTGWKSDGAAAGGFIHLINSGATTMDGTGKQKINGKPAMKPFRDIMGTVEAGECLDAVSWRPADLGYFRAGGYSAARPEGRAVQPIPIGTRRGAAYSSDFLTERGMPVTMTRINLVKGIGPVLQIAEGVTATLPDAVHDKMDKCTSETARKYARA
ncbi:MAG: hypothetical protein A2413_11295 [Treponema sp. RIFOXYC1_FULL_61_9]|nr:MAG: hypothetical protein A2413_11295 [Treponema sp. RIFOXYC1_FULL_61_9]